MKLNEWSDIIKKSRHWVLLLCMSNAFFIFLAWLANPDTFKVIVLNMIVFSCISLYVGVLFEKKKDENDRENFYHFIQKPSVENEKNLIKQVGSSHRFVIGDLANSLRMLNDELSSSKLHLKSYETFIESWVHEIKTPISLLTFVTENRKEEMSLLVYQRLEHVRMAVNENVEKILFYARLQATHMDYRLDRILLSDILEEILFDFQPLLDEKGIKVVSKTNELKVVTDEKMLTFILGQIFSNSVKYLSEKENPSIWIRTSTDHIRSQYCLEIEDNGCGVLASDLPFIFDKGMTGNHTTQKQSTGIGLYLVWKLCNELQININVESEYGKGFTIQFLFPFNVSEEPPKE